MEPTEWRKASKSGNNGACVEVARLDEGVVGVRDSKDRGTGPILRFAPAEWQAFVDAASRGEFDPH